MWRALWTIVVAVLAGTADAHADAVRLVGPFPRDAYPQAVIERPLTLPAGMVEVEAGGSFRSRPVEFRFFRFELAGVDDEWDADVAVRLGVTDRVQLEIGTAFNLDFAPRGHDRRRTSLGQATDDVRPSLTSWRRVVPVRLSILALDSRQVDTAATLTLPFRANGEGRRIHFGRGSSLDLPLWNGDGRVLPAVDLAAPTRWRVTDRLWLRAGEHLFRVRTGDGVASFAFDLGVGVQLHQILAVTLDSRIARIAFDGGGHVADRTLADVGTIDLEGTLAPLGWLDLVGSLALPDVGRGFDDWGARLAIRARR